MTTYTDHDRHRRRYGKADEELVGCFSSALGVKAQNLDSSGGGFNSHEAHWGRLRAMQRGSLAWFDAVAATIVQLPLEHRRVVTLVYAPHGAPWWLQDALLPPWGGGSFVRLSLCLPRAALAAAGRPEGTTVLDWLDRRGRRSKDDLIVSLREDCEALRMTALIAYEALRIARIKAEQESDREASKTRSERNLALYTALVGRSRRKEHARLELRMKGRAA